MRPLRRAILALAFATALALGVVATASAHTSVTAGPWSLAIGWRTEPAYVGLLNAVEVTVRDAAGTPLTDLFPGDLLVVVGTAGRSSDPQPLLPTTGIVGSPEAGTYAASLIPTQPGNYMFHLTGSIDGQAVDLTVASGPGSFDPVVGSGAIAFPDTLPSAAELTTRLDRIDARVAEAATRADADRALLIGGGLGVAGLVFGLAALGVALRSHRREAT